MSKTPFMPLWVNDFIGDTLDLDAKEVGAYMLILMAMWGRDGTLPDDTSKLKRVARIGRDWPKVWAAIEGYFKYKGGRIYNERLLLEYTSVNMKREVNAHSGARGGHAKALKSKELALANATNSLQRNATISESELESDNKEDKPSLLLNNNDDFYDQYLEAHPKPRECRLYFDAAVLDGVDPKLIVAGAKIYDAATRSFDKGKIAFADNFLSRKIYLKYLPTAKLKPPRRPFSPNEVTIRQIIRGDKEGAKYLTPETAAKYINCGALTKQQLQNVGVQI